MSTTATAAPKEPAAEFAHHPAQRLASIDAFRGLVMFLMMAEVLRLSDVARAVPDSGFWKFLSHHQSHVEWVGCSLHDLIQPSFSFLVGVGLPFSIAARLAKGASFGKMFGHAAWRALLLIVLGIFLRSTGARTTQTNFTFEDTLTQIGLGYTFLFLLGFASRKTQWSALALILVGYWAAFVLYPVPDLDLSARGLRAPWTHDAVGFAAHWNKNANAGAAFDRWFLNLFPRQAPFTNNGGGYLTLSFIPTLGTMILGLLAGGWLKSNLAAREKLVRFAIAGVAGLALAVTLHLTGVCPIVKRIWTPTWTLFSGGWCFLLLAAFFGIIEVLKARAWAFPLIVIGVNSIAAYMIAHLFEGFILKNLKTNLGQNTFKFLGAPYEPLLHGAAALFVMWLILLWMYRRKLFLKI